MAWIIFGGMAALVYTLRMRIVKAQRGHALLVKEDSQEDTPLLL